MSQLSTSAEARSIFEGLCRQNVMDGVRGAAVVGFLLLAWMSLHPFPDLSNMLLADVTTGSQTTTYAAFGGFAFLFFVLVARDNWPALNTLLSPGFILLGAWILISVVLSRDLDTSTKRFVLTLCVLSITATITLLAKSANELMRWFSIAALCLLLTCYLGVLLAPGLSTHLATDAQESALAGDWRGAFGHKNIAAAVMAMTVFIGIYVMRSGAWLSGASIVVLAALFLFFSRGKSSFALCIIVLALTTLTTLVRSFWGRAVLLLLPLLMLNMLGIGSVMSDTLAAIASKLPLDTSFTGRTDIWTFGIELAKQRLAVGYGFSAFWGSSSVRNLPEGMEWAAQAAHSHNGYLDTTLTMGLPGLALLIAVLVFSPLRNFQTAECGGNAGPLTMLFLRIWLFAVYLSSLESFYFDRDDPIWITFMIAVFGLHYLARFRLQEA